MNKKIEKEEKMKRKRGAFDVVLLRKLQVRLNS